MPSIVSKLRRFGTMKLSRMQDIGGLRAVVTTLKQVRDLEDSYRNSRFKHELVAYKNYVEEPKATGYRSVHMVYRYINHLAPEYQGLLVELQLRTRRQHVWATAVETMGTFLDHALKSSEGPDRWLNFFALSGAAFAHLEGTTPIAGYEALDRKQTYAEVIDAAKRLEVREHLRAFTIAADHIVGHDRKGTYHLIVLDPPEKRVEIQSFSRDQLENANRDYVEVEKRIEAGEPIQAVLVRAGPIAQLRRAYPNYFLDAREFIEQLDRFERSL